MPWVWFEPTIPASKRARTVYALDRSATVTGITRHILYDIFHFFFNKKSHYGQLVYSFTIHQKFYSPLLGFGLFFSFVIFFTQAVELLGRMVSLSQGRYLHTGQHTQRIKAHKHSCLEWDSKPRSQCSSERRQFMSQTARPLCSAWTNCTHIYFHDVCMNNVK
jgi:hypothetical protein